MIPRIFFDGPDMSQRVAGIVASGYSGQIAFGHVAGEQGRLRSKEEKFARGNFFLVGELEGDRRFSGIEMRQKFFDHRRLGLRVLEPARTSFWRRSWRFCKRGEIGEDQFGVDHFDVAHRIDRAADVMDVAILETAHDLHDRVHFADVAEELVAESFAGARAFHEPRDIDELNRGRNDFLRMGKLGQHLEPRIGHGHDAEVRVDRAKGIIRGLRLAGAGDGIEESGFANVRQTNDSGAQHRRGG